MAKPKAKGKKNNARNPPPARKQKGQTRQLVRGLDPAARAYAKLLNDPCYAPLVQPVYDSAGSGLLLRLENDFILGAEATSVGAAIMYIPGVMANTSTACGVWTPSTVVNSDTGTIVWAGQYAFQPGHTLSSTFGAMRSVAACMQISYVGAELTRAGVVSLGQSTFQAVAGLNTVAKMRSASERVVKMPDGVLEVKLAPTGENSGFHPVTSAAEGLSEQPCLFATCSGIPSSVGVRVRLVNVVEFLPAGGSGMISSTSTTPSTSSLGHVLAEMQAKNPQWRYELLTGLGAYAAKAIAWL